MPYSHRINAINARWAGPLPAISGLTPGKPIYFWPFIRGPCPSVCNDGAHLVGLVYLYITTLFQESCWDNHPRGSMGSPKQMGFHVVGQPFENETSDHLDVFLIFFRFKQMLVVHNYRFSDTYSMRWCSSIQRFWLNNRPMLWYLGG